MSIKDAHRVWEQYDAAVRRRFIRVFETARKFEREHVSVGSLWLPEDATAIVTNAAPEPFLSSACAPGYHSSSFNKQKAASVAASSHYRKIDGALHALLSDCVAQLHFPISELLGSPWRILNVRAWTTPPIASNSGMYAFHRDGFPPQIFKTMIYFTPMDREHGAFETEDKLITGPAGSWVLFFNSTLTHRGLPGRTYERACAEITLSRSLEFNTPLLMAGVNAHWPLRP